MLQKYSFFCVFALLLTGFHWWSSQVELSSDLSSRGRGNSSDLGNIGDSDDPAALTLQTELRRDLLEVMDRLVDLENQYRSLHGHYTQLISHLDYVVPPRLARTYEIRVLRASKSGLQISAISEEGGRVQDRAWVDESFRLTANFPIPQPSVEYLKHHAARELRRLRDQDEDGAQAEEGVFKGYFRYEVRRDSADQPVPVAIGILPPVLGVQLEAGSKKMALGENQRMNEPGTDGRNPNQSVNGVAPGLEISEMSDYARQWTDFAQLGESDPTLAPSRDRQIASIPDSTQAPKAQTTSDRLIIESISE